MTTTERWFDVTIDCGGGYLKGELTLDRLCYVLRDLAPNAYEVEIDTKGHVFGGTAGDVLDALHTEFNPLTDARARTIACNWHGGQDSPLYALCSSGAVLPDVLHEIDDNIAFHDRDANVEELVKLRTYAELNIERGPVKGWADLWEETAWIDENGNRGATFTFKPVSGGDHDFNPHAHAERLIEESVDAAQATDLIRRLATYVVHTEDEYVDLASEALTQEDWDFISDMRAALSQDEDALDALAPPVSGGDHESPTYVFDATIHVRVYVSGFDNEPDARREAEFQIASLEFTDDDTDVTEFSIQDWNRLDPMPVSGGDHTMPDTFFRTLASDEEAEFRQWARENYTTGTATNPTWHPVVRDECERMNAEQPQEPEADEWSTYLNDHIAKYGPNDGDDTEYGVVVWQEDDHEVAYVHAQFTTSREEAFSHRDKWRVVMGLLDWGIEVDAVEVHGYGSLRDFESVDELRKAIIDNDEPNLYFCDACKRGIPDSEPIHTIEDGRTVCSTCYEDRSIPDDEPKADVWAVFVGSPNDRMEGPYDTREEAFDAALELIGGWYGDESPKPHVIATKFYGSGEGRAAWHVYEREEDEFDTRVLAQHIWIDTVAADTQFED